MTKTEQVQKEMIQALKDKKPERKGTLSMLLSALKLAAKDKRSDLTEEEENKIIMKEIKQTKETQDSMPDNLEVQAECKMKLEILNEFAPKLMSEDEISAAIDKVLADLGLENPTPQDKGNIMKNLMPIVKGKSDGGLVNKLVSQKMN